MFNFIIFHFKIAFNLKLQQLLQKKKAKLAIVDSFSADLKPEPLKYYITSGHIKK